MACTMPWMKKILKDRIEPFAVAVEESLEQAAHTLSSSGWCLPEQGFYYFFSGTRTDLKWATTTVSNWCQFWQGGIQSSNRIRGALTETLFADTDSNTGLSRGQHPQWSCREREGMALPGAEISQLAGQCCTVGFLFPCAQWGHWGMASNGDRLKCSPWTTRYVCMEMAGARKEVTPGGGLSTDTPQLRSETSKYLLARD